MPAAVETAVFSNLPAWHGLGTVVDTEGKKGIDIATALELSGLDWEVEKVKIQSIDGDMIDDRWGVRRMTDKRMLGVVGNAWQPVQNHEGFQIIQDVIEQAGGDQVWIEAAGSLEGGRRVWVLAHLNENLQIAGEDYASYLLFTNGHNGRCSVTAAALDMRVVCANTLEWGLSTEAKGQGRIVRVRHTNKASERIKEAHAILKMRHARKEELAKQGEWLVEHTMDEAAFADFLDGLMPLGENKDGTPAHTMISDRRATISKLFFDAPNLGSIRGTQWSALQAVTEYADHHRNFQDQETQLKAQWNLTNTTIKQQAYDLVIAGYKG